MDYSGQLVSSLSLDVACGVLKDSSRNLAAGKSNDNFINFFARLFSQEPARFSVIDSYDIKKS
jgi:hypothetical protein